MEKLNEKERVTLTLLAEAIKIDQSALSNYISGRRNLPYDLACDLEKITGIFSELWLQSSWYRNEKTGKRARFILRRQLALRGTDEERNLASSILRENYNKYIDNLL